MDSYNLCLDDMIIGLITQKVRRNLIVGFLLYLFLRKFMIAWTMQWDRSHPPPVHRRSILNIVLAPCNTYMIDWTIQ